MDPRGDSRRDLQTTLYFDNVVTKFIVNNRTDASKTDINLFFTITNCQIVFPVKSRKIRDDNRRTVHSFRPFIYPVYSLPIQQDCVLPVVRAGFVDLVSERIYRKRPCISRIRR